MRLVAKEIMLNGFSVKIADWRFVSETQGRYFNEQEIPSDVPTAQA
jgi:hypothetical protein